MISKKLLMTILTPLLPKFKRWLGSKDVLEKDEFCQSILLNIDKNDEIRIDIVALKVDEEKGKLYINRTLSTISQDEIL
jgi:hypothetical protein